MILPYLTTLFQLSTSYSAELVVEIYMTVLKDFDLGVTFQAHDETPLKSSDLVVGFGVDIWTVYK
jgi:hypothetical protein